MNFGMGNTRSLSWGMTQNALESGVRIPFLSTWNTSQPGTSNSQQVTLPLEATGNYNFIVNWGDGNEDTITAYDDAAVTHTYSSSGNYVIDIVGEIQGWFFNNTGDCQKLEAVSKWGQLRPGNSGSQFYGCVNMIVDAAAGRLNIAYSTTNMTNMFRGCTAFDQDLSTWDTSAVTDMSYMFYDCAAFDQDLANWDVEALTAATSMLENTTLSTANYDSLLISWADQTVISGVSFHGGSAQYSAGDATTARASLVTDGWTMADGGQVP